jgi:hypothetical protein
MADVDRENQLRLGRAARVRTLPAANAAAIRLVESGSLPHPLHKGRADMLQRRRFTGFDGRAGAGAEVLPELARYIGPACYVRAGIATPVCTEGSHFCGIKVWQEFPNIERRL